MAGIGYVFTKTSQMASIGVIFTSTYHTKQLNPWPNSSASPRVVKYSQLSACQGEYAAIWRRPVYSWTFDKPHQKQPGQLSASIPGWIVSQRVQLLFDGEKYVLLLCAWKLAFLRSGHMWPDLRKPELSTHKILICPNFKPLIVIPLLLCITSYCDKTLITNIP